MKLRNGIAAGLMASLLALGAIACEEGAIDDDPVEDDPLLDDGGDDL